MKTSDLPSVGALLASAWEPKIRPYMISSQHGFKAFLEAKMTNPESESLPWEWYVATDEDEMVIGFAEFKLTEANIGLLPHIVVNEFSRGRGLATSLIEQFVMSHNSLERLELDVFDDNYSAFRLYEELGFIQHSQNVWLRRRIVSHSTPLHFSQSPGRAPRLRLGATVGSDRARFGHRISGYPGRGLDWPAGSHST